MDNSIDKQFIISEIAKVACVPEDKIKVAILHESKCVHIFIFSDIDVDDIDDSTLYQYIREFGYNYHFFAAPTLVIERVTD